jgi:hypothetical protein
MEAIIEGYGPEDASLTPVAAANPIQSGICGNRPEVGFEPRFIAGNIAPGLTHTEELEADILQQIINIGLLVHAGA